jgi:peptidoglycan/LPS O-acetylase OafA/YrhL
MSASAKFRPDIEGLRAIAVLVVVAFHCGISGFSGGFVGVDVFFVLSGYLITGLLVAEVEKTSRLNLIQFYARRVRRLLPAFALVTLVTLSVGTVILGPQELIFFGRAAGAAAVYASNIFFSRNASDYFAPNVETNPMLHTWSLAVEEQFYLFWPILIIMGLQWWRSRKVLVAMLFLLTTISFAVCVWSTANQGTFAFYELPARAWEFGVGGLGALLPAGGLKMGRGYSAIIGWLGFATIICSAHFISANGNFPGWVALFPVMGTVAALVVGVEQPHYGVNLLLDSRPLQNVGGLSYSWYLWHWPFLVFAAVLFPSISVRGKIFAVGLSLGAAALTQKVVENPVRFSPFLIRRSVLSLQFAAALTLCSVSAAFLSIRVAGHLANTPEMKALSAAVDDIAKMPREKCVSLGDSSDVKTCVFGDLSSATDVVLFGDSHAIQWFNPLLRDAQLHGWKLTTMVKSGCPAIDFRPSSASRRFADNCALWRSEAIRRILSLRPSLVFAGNATTYLEATHDSEAALADWRNGTRRTFSALTATGLRVAEIRDVPRPSFDVPTCLARFARQSWFSARSCDINEFDSVDRAVLNAEDAGVHGIPNVYVIDLTGELCPRDVCPVFRRGLIVYRDSNHLTGTFAESLAPTLDLYISHALAHR